MLFFLFIKICGQRVGLLQTDHIKHLLFACFLSAVNMSKSWHTGWGCTTGERQFEIVTQVDPPPKTAKKMNRLKVRAKSSDDQEPPCAFTMLKFIQQVSFIWSYFVMCEHLTKIYFLLLLNFRNLIVDIQFWHHYHMLEEQ